MIVAAIGFAIVGSAAAANGAAAKSRTICAVFQTVPGSISRFGCFAAGSSGLPSRSVPIAEYHGAWAKSPGSDYVAVARGGRGIGIEVIDVKRMRIVKRVRTGIAVEALAWLGRGRVVAALQRGGVVLLDTQNWRVRKRWPQFSFPDDFARTSDALVMVAQPWHQVDPNMPLAPASGATRVVIVNAGGKLKSVTLQRVRGRTRLDKGLAYRTRAHIALAPDGRHAYVAMAGSPLAIVNLASLKVHYRELDVLRWPSRERDPDANQVTADRNIEVAGDRIAISGTDFNRSGTGTVFKNAGVSVTSLTTRGTRTIDPNAGAVVSVPDGWVTYNGDHPSDTRSGLGFYDRRGRPAGSALPGQHIQRVIATSNLLIAATNRRTNIGVLTRGQGRDWSQVPFAIQDVVPLRS